MKGVWVGLLVVLAGRCAAQTLHALPALSSPATDLLLGFDGEALYFGRSPAVVEGERLNFSAVRGVGYFEFSTPDRLDLAPFSVPQWEGSGPIAHAAVDAARGMAVFSAPGKRGDLDLFVVHRERLVASVRVHVFGHALLEKLESPFKAITAHAWPLRVAPDTPPRELDAALAASLEPGTLDARAFCPLPVMGLPGWCGANADPAFYNDAAVFRPGRRGAAGTPRRGPGPGAADPTHTETRWRS